MNVLDIQRWSALWRAAGATGDPLPVLEQLRAAYSEPHRHYHNLRHIAECLGEFEPVRTLAQSQEAVELALWFHDAVYDTTAADNEERSAVLARSCLSGAGVPDALVRRIERLVLATKRHDVSLDVDAPVLVDIDLSILGQPQPRFLEYERQIREEYSWVPPKIFAEKRAEILRSFVARDRIYWTPRFYDLYEKPARKNLELSIAALSGS